MLWLILIKFGRMMHNDNRHGLFVDEMLWYNLYLIILKFKITISCKKILQKSYKVPLNFTKYCDLSFSRQFLTLRKVALLECLPKSALRTEVAEKSIF